ncbi:hypothetical protein AWC38_SpisGene18980 [Stylophora pistillata]|uniref:C2H2-type domain-containing protein n=1 Tax=Stylophora pistillata TaxID=50429 RepID=A0A2B4RHT3_STYPI|nr:hypothetical protein AWC38_SpisGene18980 [Stylophora pistillata]
MITFDGVEKKEDLKHDHGEAREAILQWKAHIIGTKNQERAKQNLLASLRKNAFLIFMYWAMKFIQLKYREKQSEWFGNRGINWHVISVITRNAEDNDLEIMLNVYLFESCAKTGTRFAQFWKTFSVTSNRSSPSLTRYDFSEPQSGKDVCDRIISPMKWEICRYCNEGHKILTAADMHEALKVRQVKGSSVAVCELVSEREELRIKRINNFSFFHNFANEKGGLRFSEAYEVGKGKLIPWSELILEEQDPVVLREVENHGFFATGPRAINQNRNHSQGSSDDNEVMLFHCPEKGCCTEFTSSVDFQDHVHRGEHSKRH